MTGISSTGLVAARRVVAASALLVVALTSGVAGATTSSRAAHLIGLRGYRHHPGDFTARLLARLDPVSLRPIPGEVLKLGDSTASHVLGPGGRTMAFGGVNYGHVFLVNLDRLTLNRSIPVVGGKPYEIPEVTVVSWPRPDRLIAYTRRFVPHAEAPARLLVINPLCSSSRVPTT